LRGIASSNTLILLNGRRVAGTPIAQTEAGVPAALVATSGLWVLQPGGGGGVTIGSAAPSRAGVTHDYFWNNNA